MASNGKNLSTKCKKIFFVRIKRKARDPSLTVIQLKVPFLISQYMTKARHSSNLTFYAYSNKKQNFLYFYNIL